MGKYYRLNQYIQAKEVRVVDEKGKQVGILPIFNAIQRARELEVDLVEVSANAKPPVCKLIDFKKFKYLEDKKEREEKKGIKGGETKEVQLSPFIARNDLEVRIKKATAFIKGGNKVRLKVRFTGRQLGKKDFGQRVIEQVIESLSEIAVAEAEPKFAGREMFVIISPSKGKKSKKENGIQTKN